MLLPTDKAPTRGRAARMLRLTRYQRIADLRALIAIYAARIEEMRGEIRALQRQLGGS